MLCYQPARELARLIREGQLTARDVWRTALVTVTADDTLAHAAQLIAHNGVAHLVVVQPHSGHPVGVLSTLDLVGVLAWGGQA